MSQVASGDKVDEATLEDSVVSVKEDKLQKQSNFCTS